MVAKQHEAPMSLGAKCESCPLYNEHRGPVLGQGRKHPKLVVVNDFPSADAVELKIPVATRYADFLYSAIEKGGLDQSELWTTNVILCRPTPGWTLDEYRRDCKEKGKADPVECCRPRLQKELTGATTVLALGGEALSAVGHFWGVTKKEGFINNLWKQFGAPIEKNGKWLFSALTPEYAIRDRRYTGVAEKDIIKAARLARTKKREWRDVKPLIFASLQTLEAALNYFKLIGSPVACDIETDSMDYRTTNLRCVGFSQEDRSFVCNLLYKSGDRVFDPATEAKVLELLKDFFHSYQGDIVFQNGFFDTDVLSRYELWPRKRLWRDTMICDRNTEANDLKHDLGSIARRYTDAPIWKDQEHKFDPSTDNSTTEIDYAIYNQRDAAQTETIYHKLLAKIAEDKTSIQNDYDHKLFYICREMGQIGLCVNRRVRRELSTWGNELRETTRLALIQQSGNPKFNPRSSAQLKKLLFGEWGLSPTLNTDGFEYEEGDDPTVSTQALMRMVSDGLSAKESRFVEDLLKFKAVDKMVGTYIDGIQSRFDPELDKYDLDIFYTQYKMNIPTGRWASYPNCYDDQTEVLTETGWKFFKDLQSADKIGQVISGTHELEFVSPSKKISYPFVGDLVRIKTEFVDLAVTPDHDLYAKFRVGRGGRDSAVARKFPADSWGPANRRWMYHAGIKTSGVNEDTNRIKLVVALQADGSFTGTHWDFSLVKHRKINRLREILTDLGVVFSDKWSEARQKQRITFRANQIPWVANYLELSVSPRIKQFKAVSLFALDLIGRKVFVDELKHWDGSFATGRTYYTAVRENADAVQAIAVSTGRRATLRDSKPNRLESRLWEVNLHDDCTSVHERDVTSREAYDGNVYCVTVPSGLVLVRRNGHVLVCGNCQAIPSNAWGKKNLRTLFVSRPGHVFVGADFNAIEGRLAGPVANIPAIREIFAQGKDLHSYNAAMLFCDGAETDLWNWYAKIMALKKADPKQYKFYRTVAKIFYFACLYGAGLKAVQKHMREIRDKSTNTLMFPGIKDKQIESWYRRLHSLQPELARWHMWVARFVDEHGYVEEQGGFRKRYFKYGCNDKNAPPNVLVQGLAAYLATNAMLGIEKRCGFRDWSPHSGLCSFAHDEIKLQVPEDRVDETERIVKEEMEQVFDGMPMVAEVVSAWDWSA